MAWVVRLLVSLIAVYILVMVVAFVFQRSLIYLPDQNTVHPSDLGLSDFNAISIKSQKLTLTSYWTPPDDDSQPVILHFHGNGGSLAGRAGIYGEMSANGAGVLAVGYPGYGGNPGRPSEPSFYAAAQANYNWLIDQGFSPSRIVIIGQSIGTGPASWLAYENEAAGLILEAPYSRLADLAQAEARFIPARWLLQDRYDSLSRIADIDMPLVWIHGRRDMIVPFAMGAQLFAAADPPKCAHIFDNAGHNDLWQNGIGAVITQQAAAMVKQGRCNAAL